MNNMKGNTDEGIDFTKTNQIPEWVCQRSGRNLNKGQSQLTV